MPKNGKKEPKKQPKKPRIEAGIFGLIKAKRAIERGDPSGGGTVVVTVGDQTKSEVTKNGKTKKFK